MPECQCGSRRLIRVDDDSYCVDCFRRRRYDRVAGNAS
jgi:hypothetical protein